MEPRRRRSSRCHATRSHSTAEKRQTGREVVVELVIGDTMNLLTRDDYGIASPVEPLSKRLFRQVSVSADHQNHHVLDRRRMKSIGIGDRPFGILDPENPVDQLAEAVVIPVRLVRRGLGAGRLENAVAFGVLEFDETVLPVLGVADHKIGFVIPEDAKLPGNKDIAVIDDTRVVRPHQGT